MLFPSILRMWVRSKHSCHGKDKKVLMEAALNEAISTLKKCKDCHDCGKSGEWDEYCISQSEKWRIIAALQNATFQLGPPLTYSNGAHNCGEHIGGGGIVIRPIAFAGGCCKLSSLLAHEAGHVALGGEEVHEKIYYMELKCFGCNRFSPRR